MEVDRRFIRVASPEPDDAGVPELVDALRTEIEIAGPITFARFMQRALYEPGLGYYATSAGRPTRAGDFLTAPELHPIFGHAIARQLHEVWQRLGEPPRFVLREYGAGSGSLGLAIAEGLAEMSSPLLERLRYQPIDLPGQMEVIERRLADAGHAGLLERPASGLLERPASGRPGKPFVGCVLANEFVDALPVHRVERREGALRELYVTWRDGRFAEEPGELSTPAIAGWFGETDAQLLEGQRAEVNVAMAAWLGEVGQELERGYALLIDYGAPQAELHAPHRAGGTLRAFRNQHVSSDVLSGVGRQDVTAQVNLDALARDARRAGLDVLGRTTQAEFLVGCGLEDLLDHHRERDADDWQALLLLRSAVRRLLDPRQLGGYSVVVLGRGVPIEPPLRGLAYSLVRRA
jgi:SAM-dependent MidA family methyltransferase